VYTRVYACCFELECVLCLAGPGHAELAGVLGAQEEEEAEEEEEEEEEEARPKKKGKGGGLAAPVYLKPALATFMGKDSAGRPEVVKEIWRHAKELNLQDPKDKRYIVCDERLFAVFFFLAYKRERDSERERARKRDTDSHARAHAHTHMHAHTHTHTHLNLEKK